METKIQVVECGCCSCYHPKDFTGDCRDNNNRFSGMEDNVEVVGITETGTREQTEQNLKGIYNLSPTAKEGYFSMSPCECCGSTLGGDRYDCTGTLGKKHTSERTTLSICVDCFEYLFA